MVGCLLRLVSGVPISVDVNQSHSVRFYVKKISECDERVVELQVSRRGIQVGDISNLFRAGVNRKSTRTRTICSEAGSRSPSLQARVLRTN